MGRWGDKREFVSNRCWLRFEQARLKKLKKAAQAQWVAPQKASLGYVSQALPPKPSPGVAGSTATGPSMPGSGIPTPYLSCCKDCGAAIFNNMVVEHEEWHETLTSAIREQIEEEFDRKPERDHENALRNCRIDDHTWKEHGSTGYQDSAQGSKSCIVCSERRDWSSHKADYSERVTHKGNY